MAFDVEGQAPLISAFGFLLENAAVSENLSGRCEYFGR